MADVTFERVDSDPVSFVVTLRFPDDTVVVTFGPGTQHTFDDVTDAAIVKALRRDPRLREV